MTQNHDLELARINADKPEDDDKLRKKLWLTIAKHVVQDNKDIKTALEFLKQSNLLKIEDILPFFPDFVLINDFKVNSLFFSFSYKLVFFLFTHFFNQEEICTALEKYNDTIDDIKIEMDEATKSGDSIRLDIRELRSRLVI